MAKKNSSKTATQNALSAAEPKVQLFTGWQGVNFKDSPLTWNPMEGMTGSAPNQHVDTPHAHRTTDLKPNYLLVQNNLETCDSMTVETRPDSEVIGTAPSTTINRASVRGSFTGVACLFHRWLFAVVRYPHENDNTFHEEIVWRDINEDLNEDGTTDWNVLHLHDKELVLSNGNYSQSQTLDPAGYEIREIGYFEDRLIVMTMHKKNATEYEGEIFISSINYTRQLSTTSSGIFQSGDSINPGNPTSSPRIGDPEASVRIDKVGDLVIGDSYDDEHNLIHRIEVVFSYVNRFGSTKPTNGIKTIYANHDPVTWSSKRCIKISNSTKSQLVKYGEITGIDIYASVDNKQTKAFIAHIDLPEIPGEPDSSAMTSWSTHWLGAMSDLSQWTNVQLYLPEENTTKGVQASHFASHDSRLYFWGDPEHPYRLYIGGDPGSELSIARGFGGAWVDIEPGTGIEVMGTAKWKTVAGANIITMMCGNPNTNMVKRFNLVETNVVITNEISSKGYMYEEVSNVVGCNSRWGYGVFADGLYSINRYGLMLTTMAMEYNSQMRNQNISGVIQPIFTERLGKRLKDARMVYIDDVIYIVLSEEPDQDRQDDPLPSDPVGLDQVILCYNLGLKSWYTFTHDLNPTEPGELILHAMAIDSDEHVEGLGLITESQIRLYPTTGIQEAVNPEFNVLMETGELAARMPVQSTIYLCQLELRFDYFIGECKCIVEGIDYYGRPFRVTKDVNRKGIGRDGSRYTTEMRSYVEWIRVDKLVESYRIRIIGPARFRLVGIIAKVYTQSARIGTPYGFDDHNEYRNRHGYENDDNHYIRDYNSLRRAIVT